MSDYTEYANQVNEGVLAAIKQTQEANLSALEAFRELFSQYAPTPARASVAEWVPSPTQVVEKTFDFAAQLLQIQKEYALRVAETIASAQKKAAGAAKNIAKATVNSPKS